MIRSLQKVFGACSNCVLFFADLYHILNLELFWLGNQPCPSWNPSNYLIPVLLCGVMIHTSPPTYWFDQPHTINPPTTPSWTPCHRINLYIISWVVKSILKTLHHMARVFIWFWVYIERDCVWCDTVFTPKIWLWSVKQFAQENIHYHPQLADQALGSLTAGCSLLPRRAFMYLSSLSVVKSRVVSSALDLRSPLFPLEL